MTEQLRAYWLLTVVHGSPFSVEFGNLDPSCGSGIVLQLWIRMLSGFGSGCQWPASQARKGCLDGRGLVMILRFQCRYTKNTARAVEVCLAKFVDPGREQLEAGLCGPEDDDGNSA